MRKVKITVVLVLLIFAGLWVWRYQKIYAAYPNPVEKSAGIGETLQMSDLSFTLEDMSLLSGEQTEKLSPDFRAAEHPDGTPYAGDEIKTLVVKVEIKNTGSENMVLDFTRLVAESGAWRNGIHSELFYALTPDLSIQTQSIKKGETIKAKLPFTMLYDMFKKKDWGKIEKRTFSMVLNLYPEKCMLVGK